MRQSSATGLIIGLLRLVIDPARRANCGWCFDGERNREADSHWASLSELGRLCGGGPTPYEYRSSRASSSR